MINTIIIDDEAHCIDHLSALLGAHCRQSVRLLQTCLTVEEGISAITALQPELVFLDVQLQDKTGFDLLNEVSDIQFDVIFTTAYEKYAIQAFRFSALDYLLKPIDPDDLVQSVARLQQKISGKETVQRIETLLQNLHGTEGLPKKLSVPTASGFLFVEVGDIVRCQSHINYTSIFLKDGRKLTVAKTLKEFEELLCGHHFFRVHNSHLVNLACIKSYNRGKGGFVSMSDHTDIEVSMRRKEELLRKLSAMAVQKRLS